MSRARRRAALAARLARRPGAHGQLPVYDERALHRVPRRGGWGRREIPLCAIRGTLEPSKAAVFDAEFRPARGARWRWQRLWLAEQRGAVLPPVSVVRIGETYVVRDGHHRVSVARARGARAIDAVVSA